MNWFERHLNWTPVLAVVLTSIYGFIIGSFTQFEGLTFLLTTIVPSAIFITIVVAWVLHRKSRNQFWLLLWWFVPLGWIFVLTLANKRGY